MTRTKRLAIIVGSLLLVPVGVLAHGLITGFVELRDADAATRAVVIAQTISEALNCFAIAAPIVALFLLIGFVLFAMRRRGLASSVPSSRVEAPTHGRDTSWHPRR